MWNANNIVQELKLSCHIHFLWGEPLHHEYSYISLFNPFTTDRMWHEVFFQVEYSWIVFKELAMIEYFLLCGWLLLSDSILVGSKPILIYWASSCLSRLQKKNKEERWREKDIFFLNFNFIHLSMRMAILWRGNVFLDYLRTAVFPKSGIEIHLSFSGLICPNSVFLVEVW